MNFVRCGQIDCEDLWMKPMYIKREGYHGGSVNGNDSKTLLKNVDIVDHVQDTLDDMQRRSMHLMRLPTLVMGQFCLMITSRKLNNSEINT